MSDYTPSEKEVVRAYEGMRVLGMSHLSRSTDDERAIARADIHRFLAEDRRKTAAKALRDAEAAIRSRHELASGDLSADDLNWPGAEQYWEGAKDAAESAAATVQLMAEDYEKGASDDQS